MVQADLKLWWMSSLLRIASENESAHDSDMSEPDRRIKLFLSHAWEDKDSFVEPLYQALKDEFDVWYDKARIALGDSIYEKISEGIRECDFGVVVFSPHFLEKKWTQEEFNGLKALQTKKRKVILPILHNLTIDDLKAKWPIEAGKLSISSSEGILAIVQAIHFAVGADRQNKDFDKDALNKAFGDFQSAKQLAKINDDLSKVREGAVKAHDAAIAVLGRVKERVDELSQGSTYMTANLNSLHGQRLQGRNLATLQAGEYYKVIESINPVWNTTTEARLDIVYFHRAPFADETTVMNHHALFPLFTLKQDVVWGFKNPKEGQSNDQVVEELIKDFIDFLEKQEGDQEGGSGHRTRKI